MKVFIKLIFNGIDYGLDIVSDNQIVMDASSEIGIIRFIEYDGTTAIKVLFACNKEHFVWANFISSK